MCTLSVTAYGAIQEEDIDLGLVHASSCCRAMQCILQIRDPMGHNSNEEKNHVNDCSNKFAL